MLRFHEGLLPLLVPIENVSQHPDNYNNGDDDLITESIEVNGMFRPIVVQRSTGYILDGNSTYRSCLGLGSQTIPVIYLDVNDREAAKILVVANMVARKARIDAAGLIALIDTLGTEPADLVGTGVDKYEYDRLLEVMATPDAPPDGYGFGEKIASGITCPECGHQW